MTALKRIQVKGFKSIREMDLELRPLNILIGANGAGKSNFLGLLGLLHEIALKNLQLYVAIQGGAKAFVHYGKDLLDQIEFNLAFDDFNHSINLRTTQENSFVIGTEKFNHFYMGINHISGALPESFLPSLGASLGQIGEAARGVLQRFEALRLYHFYDPKAISQTSNVGDNLFLRPDGSNIASMLYLMQLKQQQYYERIVETIQLVAPFFDDFNLLPNRENSEKIRLEWREKGTDSYRPGYLLSDGTLRFICLATLLRQPNPPPLILIDEPELGLHPYAITLLAAMLKSASVDTQVIVSTQSPTLINHFKPEDIIVVDREKQESTFRRLDSKSLEVWLKEFNYTLSDLWEMNLVGGRP